MDPSNTLVSVWQFTRCFMNHSWMGIEEPRVGTLCLYSLGYRRTQIGSPEPRVTRTLCLYNLGYRRTQIGSPEPRVTRTLCLFLYFRVWELLEIVHIRPLWGWQYIYWIYWTNAWDSQYIWDILNQCMQVGISSPWD